MSVDQSHQQADGRGASNGGGELVDGAFLFVPQWWMSAWRHATVAELSGGVPPVVWPEWSGEDFGYLAGMLRDWQIQLLQNLRADTGTESAATLSPIFAIQMRWSDLHKNLSSSAQRKIKNLLQSAQNVTNLRLLFSDAPNAKGQVHALRAEALFKAESLRFLAEGSADGRSFAIECTDVGRDLILGYTQPWIELARAQAKQTLLTQHHAFLQGPLALWRSVWMDLTDAEQMTYLRFEDAIQTNQNWLHLDGVFSCPLDAVLGDLTRLGTPLGRVGRGSAAAAQQVPTLDGLQHYLTKLARKLVGHGWLKSRVDAEGFAYASASGFAVQLVWQTTPAKAFGEEAKQYRQEVLTALAKLVGVEHLQLVNKSCPWLLERLMQLRQDLLRVDAEVCTQVVVGESTSCPLTTLDLYCEWALRRQASIDDDDFARTSSVALPKAVAQNDDIARMMPLESHALPEVKEMFYQFSEIAVSSKQVRRFFELPQNGGLAPTEAVSLLVPQTIQQWKARGVAEVEAVEVEVKSSARVARPAPTQAPQVVQPKAPPVVARPVDRRSLQNREVAVSGSSSVNQNKLRRVAADELVRMRQHAPQQYEHLKNNYLQKLDEKKRKLLLELRDRMQAELFENHLKHNLIKFMIEHPALWKSASSGSAAAHAGFPTVGV